MSNLKPFGDTIPGLIGEILYGGVTAVRNLLFDLFPPAKLPFPVISIGGISAGGTGKTPLTATVIEHLIGNGYTPVLFSRGYGRESKECLIIPSGESCPSWKMVGDEPAMLRHRYPELWLAINGSRMKAAKALIANLPKRCVGVMDDGFQHRKMHRDLNIVTLPPSIFKEHLIPRGLLREPLSSLKRADIITVMGEFSEQDFTKLRKFNKKISAGSVVTGGGRFINPLNGSNKPTLPGSAVLFSGIARPERFHQLAEELGVSIKKTHTFPDHHIYSEIDFDMLKADSKTILCTTEKDWIRLVGKKTVNFHNLWYLSIVQRFTSEVFRKRFFDLIDYCMECSNDRSYS